ncbi:proteoglycan 4 isoform 3-T3 [Leptodactylus fuscus]|uniref:proteoglycan 4 isoform X3 n=1 Tax=Leptodactylus fuscus TaxID=238119 RepID=UPI003F4F3E39
MKIYRIPLIFCFIVSIPSVSSQSEGSCVGRCGQGYVRADPCHCDYNCMSYMECCPDYKKVCTTEASCKGRCHEGFIRGQTCDCDPGCSKFGKCCPDYEDNCAQPTPPVRPAPSSQDQPVRGGRDEPPEPTKKPEDKVPEDKPEDPNQKRPSPKDKKRPPKKSPKKPKKKKPIVESEEEIQEAEENLSSSSFSSSTSSLRGSKKTKKLSRKNQKKNTDDIPDPDNPDKDPRDPNQTPKGKDNRPKKPKTLDDDDPESRPGDPTSDGPDKNPKKPKGPGDDTKDPAVPPKAPTPDDKNRQPKKPKGTGDDTSDPDVPPKEPTPKDKDGKPKKPKGTGDDDENPDTPEEPNQRKPGDGDKPRKPKNPNEKEPEDTGKSPKEPNPKEKKKPDETSSVEIEETTEEHTEDVSNDSPENPSPPKKRKKRPNNVEPNRRRGKPTDEDYDDPSDYPSPRDGVRKRPNSRRPNKKKVKPTDEDDNEPSKPGKGKNPKKKPNPKEITKVKKKIDSEEERQETVESEYSSSSQSSSSHTRSKSTRRLTGKNKKKLTDKKKKKIPEETPEDPLMPPKPKKDNDLLSTPEPTTKDEGSGDDGSGMDFLPTTTPKTTLKDYSTTSTALQTTMEKNQTEGTVNPSKSPTQNPDDTSDKGRSSTPSILPTADRTGKTTNLMNPTTQSPTTEAKTTGKSTPTDAPLQQTSTMKTPQDQSTAGSSGIIDTTVSGKLQETTNTLSSSSKPVDPTTQTLPITDNATTQKSEQAQTKETVTQSDITVISTSTTKHSDHTMSSKATTKGPSAAPQQTEQPVKLTEEPEDKSEVSTIMSTDKQTPTPAKSVIFETTTEYTDKDDNEMSTKSVQPTETPNPKDYLTNKPLQPEEMEHAKTPKPSTTNPYHICDLIKDEAIKLRISDDDLQHVIEICNGMQQQYQLVSTPSPDVKQPNTDDRNTPSTDPDLVTPNGNQPGVRIVQIVEEIYRRMNSYPMINITVIRGYNTHKPTKWLLLLNKIKSANDPQKNLCIGKPVDGMTTLQNGSMVVFRGPYFWMLNQEGVMGSPRKISEVWGIPSPIDTVFTRCNCGGKTFFFKGSRYWRFTNDVMDQGYPKEIIRGFGGLRGKVTAVLPVAGFRTRPESVYFFKPGGFVQKYTFRQEQAKKCTKKKRPSVQYPIYSQKIQTVKYRFPRNVVRHRIQIHRTYTAVQQPLGVLHQQALVRSTWRGIPNNIISAVSLPNYGKQDGFDYYVFAKDKYYNINMSSKIAAKPLAGSEQKTTKDWYNCKE